MHAVEASAKTREEAIQNALKDLGVEMYEVDKIEILDEGSKGLFGFGARPVKVRLVVENMQAPTPRKAERPAERPAEDRGGRERAPERPREERGRDDRPRGGDRAPQNREKEAPRQDRGERPRGGGQEARPERAAGEGRGGNEARGNESRGGGERGGRGGENRGGGNADRGGENRGGENRGSGADRGRTGEARGGERGGRGGENRGGGDRDRNRDRDRGGDRGGRGGDRGPRRDGRPQGGGGRDGGPTKIGPSGDSEFGYDPDHDHAVNPPAEGAAPVQEARAPRPPREPREDRGPRPERQERGDRPERPARPPRAERPAREADAEGGDAEVEVEAGPQTEQSQAAEEASFAPLTDAQGAEAAGIMQEIISKMGITATSDFVRIEDGGARLNIESEDGAILIGRKGRTLSALQYLVNRMISRGDTAENTERLIVDVGGYVDRRRESLEDMARSLADKAKGTGRNMRLKPMSPQERRIIHVTLQDDPDVRTFSLGESLFRSVIISPKNASADGPARSPRGGRGRGQRGGRGRGGQRRDRFEVDAGQFGD